MEQRPHWQDETHLERIAWRAGLTPDELRQVLRAEISARRGHAHTFDDRLTPKDFAPTAEEWAWAEQQPPEIRDAVKAFLNQF